MEKNIDNLQIIIPETVYDPAEDSFLLAENVTIFAGNKVLEVGSGTGYVSIYLSRNNPGAEFFCLDYNYYAAQISKRNATNNDVKLEVIFTDLFSGLKLRNTNPFFNVVLFNSPYLPVDENTDLGKAWSGGKGGISVIQNFLKDLNKIMTLDGRCYLVVSSKTDLLSLEKLFSQNNLHYTITDKIKERDEIIILYQLKRE